MKKNLFALIISFIFVSSLPSPSHAFERATPSGTAIPSVVRPGEKITFSLKGFSPKSKLRIADGDKGFEDFIFGTDTITDINGSFAKIVTIPAFSEHGVLSIPFQDEDGNRVDIPIEITGQATKKIIFGANATLNEINGLYTLHLTGVGWIRNKKKTVADVDERIGEKQDLFYVDNCITVKCAREDALDITLSFPPSTIPGQHRILLSEEGETAIETIATLPPRNDEGRDQGKKPLITLIDPPVATAEIPSLLVRGEGWGSYKNRKFVRAWLINAHNGTTMLEFKVDRNYNDDELFLRLEFPGNVAQVKPDNYRVYILTENGKEATAPFVLIKTLDLRGVKKATLSITPSSGSIGTYVVLTAGGFSKKTGLIVRIDGIKMRGAPITDADGFFDNVGITIPAFLEKDNKLIPLKNGKHTIEITENSGAKLSASAIFMLGVSDDDRKKEEQAKKELEDKEKKEKEEKAKKEKELKDDLENIKKVEEEQARIEKERQQLEKLQKQKEEEQKKKEQQDKDNEVKKIEKELKDIEQKKEKLEDKKEQIQDKKDALLEEKKKDEKKLEELNDSLKVVCSKNIPDYLEPGCKKKREDFIPPTLGKACQEDVAITFQPGCIPQSRGESEKPFKGKMCTVLLPLIWQEGCTQQERKLEVPETLGKPCRTDMAITFQPGCISQERILQKSEFEGKPCTSGTPITFQPGCISPIKPELEKPFKGKVCDRNLPLVWQEGCIQEKKMDGTTELNNQSSSLPRTCNPSIPLYAQQGCKE